MDSRIARTARAAHRGLAVLVALLVAGSGVAQASHGTAAAHARTVAARCDGSHAGPALHGSERATGHHDEARCAVCHAFAHARIFQQPPALLPPLPSGVSHAIFAEDTATSADRSARAHPPRAPPFLGRSAA